MKIMLGWKSLFIILFLFTQTYTIAIAQTSTACPSGFEEFYFQSCNNEPVSFPLNDGGFIQLRHGDSVCGYVFAVDVAIVITTSTGETSGGLYNSFSRSPNPAYLNSCVDYETLLSEEASQPSGTDVLFSGLLVLSPLLLCLGSSGGGGVIIIIIIIFVKK